MFFWNPNPVAFTIPLIDTPIYLYGICFVFGFVLGYALFLHMVRKQLPNLSKNAAQSLVDQLTWFLVCGMVIGMRLGHVIFYDWERYLANPWMILNTREGGLASHGGAIGILMALGIFHYFIFRKKTGWPLLRLLDMLVIPTALTCVFIRIGNFFNQEIIGTPTTLPWAVIFGTPADHHAVVPRHPAQLYEALAIFATFLFLFHLWKRTSAASKQGLITGLFFVCVFGSRFLIEFIKELQTSVLGQQVLQVGQWLSIPFILGGLYFIINAAKADIIFKQKN